MIATQNICQCTRCAQVIKNIVMIGGKPYGTTCAEIVSGVRLPQGFTGDLNKHLKNVEESQRKAANFRAACYRATREFWADAYKLTVAMNGARRASNYWETDFIESISTQLGWFAGITDGTIEQFGPEGAEAYIDSIHGTNYGIAGNPRTRSMKTLSDKQRTLVDKIYNKYSN